MKKKNIHLRSWVKDLASGYLLVLMVFLAYCWTSSDNVIREDGRLGNAAIIVSIIAIGALIGAHNELIETIKNLKKGGYNE